MPKTTNPRYDSTPVVGYGEGLVISPDERPVTEYTDRGDMPPGNNANANSWFYIGERKYNVHPFRADLGGYPVRWSEAVAWEEYDEPPESAKTTASWEPDDEADDILFSGSISEVD